jgi:hypothetical protein
MIRMQVISKNKDETSIPFKKEYSIAGTERASKAGNYSVHMAFCQKNRLVECGEYGTKGKQGKQKQERKHG